jgi:hypothetical protein
MDMSRMTIAKIEAILCLLADHAGAAADRIGGAAALIALKVWFQQRTTFTSRNA